jgi:translation initiation factor 6 (eIF-6)
LEQVDSLQALTTLHNPLCLGTVQFGQPFVQSCLLESQRNELAVGILVRACS